MGVEIRCKHCLKEYPKCICMGAGFFYGCVAFVFLVWMLCGISFC